jgi:parvulin-like peptidyl-prolyl isomerase
MARLDRSSCLLALGSGLGLALAAGGLLASGRDPGRDLPPGAVAQVNGVPIRAEDYRRALAAVTADRREPPDPELRRHVLDRLVDEELLVQRGLALGLVRVDPRVRRELAAAVIAAAVAEGGAGEPSPEELTVLYETEGGFFAGGARLHVRQVFVPAEAPEAEERAREAARRLRAGEALEAVRTALGAPEPVPLPDAPLPAAKLADYLGPTALRTALGLTPGRVSEPVRSAAGHHVLLVVRRDGAAVPPLAAVEAEVRAEWHRRASERALHTYLDQLRLEAEVTIAPALPE